MAIRKDLDDMLNNLKGRSPEKSTEQAEKSVGRKSIYDTMSVDDLLDALTVEKKPSLAENILNELDSMEKEDVPETKPEPIAEPVQSSARNKKKVVITGELPDYEELRHQELEQMKQERLRAENRQKFIPAVSPETAEKAVESAENTGFKPPEDLAETKVMNAVTETDDSDINLENTIVFPDNEPVQDEPEHRDQPENLPEKKPESSDNSVQEDQPVSDEKNDDSSDDKKKKVDKKKKKSKASRHKKHQDQVESSTGNEKENTEESATDLIDAALAAIREAEDVEVAAESSGDDMSAPDEAAQEQNNSEEIQDIQSDSEDQMDDKKDGVSSLIEGIRENAASAIAELDNRDDNEDQENNVPDNDNESQNEIDEKDEKSEKKSRVTSAFTKILDEDPETLIDVKREKTEENEEVPIKKKRLKRRIYAVLGVVFTLLAVIGAIDVAGRGVRYFKSFASGEMKKDSFTEMIYPVVIMDIESFDKPADLTSEQIITASIWSIIMDDEKRAKYPVNVAGGDIITISAYDVEAEAVALFGQDHAPFEHTTVGPVTSRFYFDPDKVVYNVPIHPIVFTYEPEIKSIVKSGNQYTLTVDYIDERPAWMEKSVSKSVEFVVTEKSDGTYQFESMKINYVKNNL